MSFILGTIKKATNYKISATALRLFPVCAVKSHDGLYRKAVSAGSDLGVNVCCVSLFQSHQARIATLYLPLFGLLIENVQRINVREVSPFPVNPGSVREHIHICVAHACFLWLPWHSATDWVAQNNRRLLSHSREAIRPKSLCQQGGFLWRLRGESLSPASLLASGGSWNPVAFGLWPHHSGLNPSLRVLLPGASVSLVPGVLSFSYKDTGDGLYLGTSSRLKS